MEQKEMVKFMVIGRCSKTQMLSSDQETSLWEGIIYNINFFQNFSALYLDGWQIKDIPVSNLIEAIAIPPSSSVSHSAPNHRQCADDQGSYRGSVWEEIEKAQAEERKHEKKWRKKHPKPKNQKEAEKKYKRIVKQLTRR